MYESFIGSSYLRCVQSLWILKLLFQIAFMNYFQEFELLPMVLRELFSLLGFPHVIILQMLKSMI